MEQQFKPFLDWLYGNWGWVIAVFCVFFEIAPIKLHPVTTLLNWIGKRLTGDLRRDVEQLRKETVENYKQMETRLDQTDRAIDEQRMASIKAVVLDFANSCRNGRKHSREEFVYILKENDEYEMLIEKYGLKNNWYTEDFKYIERIYQECMAENKFLA